MPSPLYAPLYLAKAMAHLDGDEDVFRHFRGVAFEYDKPDPPHGDALDTLIEGVLSVGSEKQEILAVGDPSRILSAIRKTSCHPPHVVGGFINKVCYTLVGTREPDDFTPLHLKSVVVHPQGMTGYSLFCHYITNHPMGMTTVDDYDVIAASPIGQEEVWYRMLHRWRSDKRLGLAENRIAGVISADPVRFAGQAAAEANFSTLWHFHKHPPYDNAAMTAFITWQGVIDEDSAAGNVVRGVLKGTQRAIELIVAEPRLCAHYLRQYSDARLRFSDYTVDRLEKTLDWLGRKAMIYNMDADLRLTREQVTTMLDMRDAAHIPTDGEKVKELRGRIDEFFGLTTAPVTPPSPVDLSVRHRQTWLDAWNHEVDARDQQLLKDVRVPQYTLAIVVGIALLTFGLRALSHAQHAPSWDWSLWQFFASVVDFSLLAFFASAVALVPAIRDLVEIDFYLRKGGPDPRIGWVPALFQLVVIPLMVVQGLDAGGEVLEGQIYGANGGAAPSSWPPSGVAVSIALLAFLFACSRFWRYQADRHGLRHFGNVFRRFGAWAHALVCASFTAMFGKRKIAVASSTETQRSIDVRIAKNEERERCQREYEEQLKAERAKLVTELQTAFVAEQTAALEQAKDACIRGHADFVVGIMTQVQQNAALLVRDDTVKSDGNGSGTHRAPQPPATSDAPAPDLNHLNEWPV